MPRTKAIELKGKSGNWIALAGTPRKVVAQARTLQAVAKKAKEKGFKNLAFARVPRANSTLVL